MYVNIPNLVNTVAYFSFHINIRAGKVRNIDVVVYISIFSRKKVLIFNNIKVHHNKVRNDTKVEKKTIPSIFVTVFIRIKNIIEDFLNANILLVTQI